MESTSIDTLRDSWQNCNESTIGFAECVPDNVWHDRPFGKRFKSFSWEFACVLRTRMCYLKGFRTGKPVFSHQVDIPDKSLVENWNKMEVVSKLKSLDVEISKQIENISDQSGVGLMLWLMQHERLHQGKLILYCSQINLTLPKLFIVTWGENNFPKSEIGEKI